jgi:hypothetical protein
MNPCEIEEYRALRATIRERGTARVLTVVVGLAAWTVLTVFLSFDSSVARLVPLLFLAVLFEAVFALHTGVERIGRYLQVFFEEDELAAAAAEGNATLRRGWEHLAMMYGKRFPGGPDPLFAIYFWAAILLNLVAATPRPANLIDWAIVGIPHAALAVRIVARRRQAARQREVDLARFRVLKREGVKGADG